MLLSQGKKLGGRNSKEKGFSFGELQKDPGIPKIWIKISGLDYNRARDLVEGDYDRS